MEVKSRNCEGMCGGVREDNGGGGGEGGREGGMLWGWGGGGYETTQVYAIEKQLMGTVHDVQCLHTQACRT